ncbi:MAG: tRNA (adenosine(37)-N6)-dimethylallyltransferase MiaA [Bacteroidota bacterium]
MERKVIVIAGPTCSGKTKVAVNLAKKLNTEIISADSRQLYKYLNIGTAKPTAEELSQIKHHLVNCCLPDEEYNASKFEQDALQIIDSLHQENKIPIVAGGSGLYIRALVDGIFDAAENDEEYRAELNTKRERYGNEFLYNELKKVDPGSASKMLPQNWKRVMRALEVFHVTGQPIWKLQNEHERESKLVFYQFGLEWKREILYENINVRVDKMIDEGFVDEVKQILQMGFQKNINSLNTVGYKEIISYLENLVSLERAVELIKRNTRHYAKRQMTWFRKDNRINWISCDSSKSIEDTMSVIFKKTLGT